MATLPFDDDILGKWLAVPQSGSTSPGGGAPVPVSGVGGGPAASAAGAAPGTGTGFINPETYLALNQGAGMGMSNTLAGGLEQSAQQVRQGVDALGEKFDQAATSGRAQAGGTGYHGPASLQAVDPTAYDKLGAQASDLAARGRVAQSGDAGSLLQVQYGQGREYGTGARGLDSFLSTTGAAGDRLRAGGAATSSLEKYLGLADTKADTIKGTMSSPPGPSRGNESPPLETDYLGDVHDPRVRRRMRGGGGGKTPALIDVNPMGRGGLF